jgi:hypothetical protein
MRYAAVYDRRGKLIVHPDGKTTAGVLIAIEPFVVLENTQPAAIGAALRMALEKSKVGLRHPQLDEWDAVAAPLYAAAGVKTWGVFVKGTELVNVEADDAVIRLLPQENCGARDGFQPRGLPAVELASDTSDQEIGSAVLKALTMARAREPHRT